MSAINLVTVMDALAAQCVSGGVATSAFAYPVDSIVPPAVVVGYPKALHFDAVFGRGSDSATFPVWFVAGRVDEKSTRSVISAIVTGASGVKDALEGNLGGVVQVCHVLDCQVTYIDIGGVPLIAAEFSVEVLS